MNLLVNALQASTRGAKVVVRASREMVTPSPFVRVPKKISISSGRMPVEASSTQCAAVTTSVGVTSVPEQKACPDTVRATTAG